MIQDVFAPVFEKNVAKYTSDWKRTKFFYQKMTPTYYDKMTQEGLINAKKYGFTQFIDKFFIPKDNWMP